MADRQRVYEGRPGLADWGEDLGELNPRVLRAVRAGAKANVMPNSSGVPFAGLIESTKSLPALPHFLGDLLTGGRYGFSERAPRFSLEASENYDALINKYLAEEGLAESSKLPTLEKYGLAAGEMLGQLPVPGKLLERVTKKLPKAFKPAGWLAEYFGPTVDPEAINYAIGTGVGGTLRTATGEEEPEKFAKGGLGRKPTVRKTEEGVAEVLPPKLEGTTIMKGPGGNWLPGSVEKFVDTVRREFITANARPAERMRQLEEAMARDPKNINLEAPGVAREKARLEAEIPVDRWLEKKLTNYIKNDMATERDPVRLGIEQRVAKVEADRAKAEQRIAKQQEKIAEAKAAGRDTTAAEQRLEIEIADLQQKYAIDSYAAGIPTLDRDMRNIAAQNRANAPLNRDPDANILATTPQSANWEDMTDYLVDAAKAGDILGGRFPRLASAVDEAPWLAKVPPETPVYSVYRGNPEYFNHVRDELYNSIRTGSDIPPELRLKADDLDKMNMDAVVAHVSKVDAWRERNRISANLAKSNNPAVFTVKQYPGTGLEWKQLKMPEIKELPEIETRQRSATQGEFRIAGDPNWYAANDMGDTYLDFEGKARDLLGTRALREALEYEGSVMGHCVGGYCDPVKAGQKQIFSLRDAKGEPHVTIEVRPNKPNLDPSAFYQSALAPQSLIDRLSRIENENPGAAIDWESLIRESPEYKAYVGFSPPDIIQIKGKGNRKPADKYIPFVQDFVKSGDFGKVGDLFNTGLLRVSPDSPFADEFRKAGRQPPKYVTQKEMDILDQWFNVDRLRGEPFPENFADGGAVQSANIDVSKLPTVRNPDGSVSTVRTIGIEMDGKHYLIPTVIGGRVVSDDEAFNHFIKTGRHLGVFSTREASDEAGRRLHEAEERRTGEKYDENEIERILAPLRQRLEPFFREARAVPRRVKQAAADATEIGPIIKKSNQIPLTIFDPRSNLGGEADAMRHLLFSSQLAQKYGEMPAKVISYVHEYTSPTQPEAQREMDLANDALGREIARSANDEKQLVELARKYVESGRAKTLPKDQRNSGY